jgi:hypothetical protein
MNQPFDDSRPADLPYSVRIMPNRSTLWLGCAASLGLALFLLLGSPASSPNGSISTIGFWSVIGLLLSAAFWCGFRLLVQLPIIEASELGIAIWFDGPYRRPFFAPWDRVRGVVLTRVRSALPARREALGIELVQDDLFSPPPIIAGAELPAADAVRADLAWSGRAISGNVRRWVTLLQRMKVAYAEGDQAATLTPCSAGRGPATQGEVM